MAETSVLRALAAPLLAEAGLVLWDVEVSHDVVRVLVDRDGGVDLDALSEASRALSTLLDGHDDAAPAGAYQLEISSPGLERTLRTPEQYRRYVGAEVTIKTSAPVAGSRRHRGTITAVSDDGVELQTDQPSGSVQLSYDQIERARTVFEWGPAPKPGTRPGAARTRPAAPARMGTAAHQPKDAPR